MEKKLSALIVDDEELARIDLKHMLAEHSSIEIVGEASDINSATKAIIELKPDVIFLDIEFPGESGFDLLEKVAESTKIVFITAFDEFAIRAFEVNACDYLLKPVSTTRLKQTIKRLESNTNEIKKTTPSYGYDDQIFISVNYKYYFIKVSSIIKISSEGKYPEILTTTKVRGLVNKSLQEWEKCLPEKHFIRIHRSTIINMNFVEKVERGANYSYILFLKSIDEPIPISRRYASKIKSRMTL
jgi:two-component system LytT family response regulator